MADPKEDPAARQNRCQGLGSAPALVRRSFISASATSGGYREPIQQFDQPSTISLTVWARLTTFMLLHRGRTRRMAAKLIVTAALETGQA
jgi:hypothetical protein